MWQYLNSGWGLTTGTSPPTIPLSSIVSIPLGSNKGLRRSKTDGLQDNKERESLSLYLQKLAFEISNQYPLVNAETNKLSTHSNCPVYLFFINLVCKDWHSRMRLWTSKIIEK